MEGSPYQYNVLLLDEAQDMNPAMLDVCLKQVKPKLVVGDSHQQIYSFRGAVDALRLVKEHPATVVTRTYYLTQSFRFGPEIAWIAECCLAGMVRKSDDTSPMLVGSGKLDCVTSNIQWTKEDKIAVLGRTNVGIFKEMVRLVCEVDPMERPNIALPRSPNQQDPLGWDLMVDLCYYMLNKRELMSEQAQRNPRYKKKWVEFVRQVVDANDMELLGKIKVVEFYRDKLPGYVQILEQYSGFSIEDKKVKYIFSTVHKFKGLECDTVRLLDDFTYEGIPYERPTIDMMGEDEGNMLYVALTRAKRNLIINDALFFLLTSCYINYSFENLEFCSNCEETNCMKCGNILEFKQTAGLYQVRVRAAVKTFRKSGWLCPLCACSGIRVINYRLGGKKEDSVDPKVRRGTVEDTGHSFLYPLVVPLGVSRSRVEAHRAEMAERSRTNEIEKSEVVEFVSGPVSAFMEDDSDDEDLVRMAEEVDGGDWMGDEADDALLLMAAAGT